jgi:hypothetical protein
MCDGSLILKFSTFHKKSLPHKYIHHIENVKRYCYGIETNIIF